MAREDKVKDVEALKSKFGGAKCIVLADYTGITVAEVSELRRKCREARVEYKVVKNTLARIAARETDHEGLAEHFSGPIAIAISSVDSVAPARVLAGFMKDFQKLTFKAGYIEGRVFSPGEVQAIASLPGRDELVARVIGAVQAPLSQVVYSVEGVLRNLISVIEQASKKA